MNNTKYSDLSEGAVAVQKSFSDPEYRVRESVHPLYLDGKLGYAFTVTFFVDGIDGPVIHDQIFVEHNGKTYLIQFQYHLSHYLLHYDQIDHVVKSIKFFD